MRLKKSVLQIQYRYSFCYLAQGSWNFWYLIEVFGTWRNKQGGHQNFVWMCLQTDWTIFLSFFYRFLCSSVHINNLRESVYKVSHFCEDDICKVLVIFLIWSSTASNGPCIPPPRLITPWDHPVSPVRCYNDGKQERHRPTQSGWCWSLYTSS